MGVGNRAYKGDSPRLGASIQSFRSRGGVLSSHGWTPPPFCQEQVDQLVTTVVDSEPVDYGLPGHGWTLKKVRRWLKQTIGCTLSRSALHALLKEQKLSWKKCQKVLKKANPQKRAAFVQRFRELFAQLCRGEIRLVYVDEAHFHRDMDLGYTWAPRNKPAWRLSECAPLSHRINWYGAYDFAQGQCFIWNEGNCNKEHTVQFLDRLLTWLGQVSVPVIIIWDGAPWHRAKIVQAAAADLGFTLIPLPGYSPDLNPIEGLWKWMREDVTQNYCHATMRQLFDECKAFIERINAHPENLVSRLWPKFELDPDFEELLVSN